MDDPRDERAINRRHLVARTRRHFGNGTHPIHYKAADPTTRSRIETGALEHALESRAVRPFFDAWGTDPTLREAHEHALAGEWLTRSKPANIICSRRVCHLVKIRGTSAPRLKRGVSPILIRFLG
jgi:hypothetical protein